MPLGFDRRIGRIAGFGLLLGIGALTASCTSSSSQSPAAPVIASAPAAPCAAEYNALLDMAELARRYGPAAGMFLDPLGDMFDQLNQCLETAQEASPGGNDIEEISARRRHAYAMPWPARLQQERRDGRADLSAASASSDPSASSFGSNWP